MLKLVKNATAAAHLPLTYKSMGFVALVLLASNFFTYIIAGKNERSASYSSYSQSNNSNQLYLANEAQKYINDMPEFEKKVRKVAQKLEIPPEWLMAVMHAESKFDASVSNQKGSGAIGLIQFMPTTAKSLGISAQKMKNLNPTEQLDFVYEYLNNVQKERKTYESLTDLYLGILYPSAVGEDFCYTMYASPSVTYKQNSGLDENKDGRVTVQDIDKHLKRIYPSAYVVPKPDAPFYETWF